MKQSISTTELKRSIGEVVSTVRLRGDCYVISQRGKEEAALVPIHVLESYERSRKRVAEIMDEAAASADLSEEEAMRIALEEVAASRAERRQRRGSGDHDAKA